MSYMDYCNSLLAGSPNYMADRLQRILNAASRLVSSTYFASLLAGGSSEVPGRLLHINFGSCLTKFSQSTTSHCVALLAMHCWPWAFSVAGPIS